MMKKILNIAILLSAVVFIQACDPMKDTYAELDINKIDKSGVKEMVLELQAADYQSLSKVTGAGNSVKTLAFASEDSAKYFIPYILNTKYKYLEETSSINVTFNIRDYNTKMNAPKAYTLTNADYLAINGPKSDNEPNVPKFTNLNSSAGILKAADLSNKRPLNGDVSIITFAWNAKPVKDSTVTTLHFDGVWAIPYTLTNADYTSMTLANPNFSSVALANQYIPIFIANKFPYRITDGDLLPVIYNLYNNSTKATTNEVCLLKYVQRSWMVVNGTVKSNYKFAFTNKKWIADNTIKYTLATDDYKVTIADLSKEELPAASANIAKYGNFDLSKWKDADIEKYLLLFANTKFPDALTDQKCQISYITFSPAGTGVKTFKKESSGKFILIK